MVLAALLFGSVFSYLLISRLIVDLVEVTGDSMYPSLHSGDMYLLRRYEYLFRDPRSGDIVAIRDPQDNQLSVKRVIGVPGDTVGIADGTVTVNGVRLTEPYLRERGTTYTVTGQPFEAVLQPEYYFVLGDNRRNSIDARFYGPVERRRILGPIREP